MNKSLLEKAKAIKANKRERFVPTKEMEEVALAWVNGEITHSQIAKALGYDNTGYRVYCHLALTLKKYINDKQYKNNE